MRSSTLIFAEALPFPNDHPLNLAAGAMNRGLCHVELAIGSDIRCGKMANVLQVFNGEKVGISSRTGMNPSFKYVAVPHSADQERRMLGFARAQVGQPFSFSGMARSPCMPRTTDEQSWFCAELIGATLQSAGLLDAKVNPAALSPLSLFDTFSRTGASTANPTALKALKNGTMRLRGAYVNPIAAGPQPKQPPAVEMQGSLAVPLASAPAPMQLGRADNFLRRAVLESGVLNTVADTKVRGLYDPIPSSRELQK